MKFGIKEFWKDTPAHLVRLGNSLLAAGMAVAGISYMLEHEKIALWVGITVAVGRFLVQFFSKHEQPLP